MKRYRYLTDSYCKELTTRVESIKDNKFVVLEDTIFYPLGGGQPYDTGKLVAKNGKEYPVVFVGKYDGVISHEVEDAYELNLGDEVTCVLDWDRRYRLMRSHTASHVLSALFHDNFGAKITGNQLSLEKIRTDFSLEDFDRDKIANSIEKCNHLLAQDHLVHIEFKPRKEALKEPGMVKLAGVMPPDVEELRIVTIGEIDTPIDRQADGGTHVRSTKECGQIELLKADNRGKNNRRVYVKFVE